MTIWKTSLKSFWVACVVAISSNAFAGELREEFEAKLAQLEQGIGGFTGAIEPIDEPINLQYGPYGDSIGAVNLMYRQIFADGHYLILRTDIGFNENVSRSGSGSLESVKTYKHYEHQHETDAFLNVASSSALPNGASLKMEFDKTGSVFGATIFPPPNGDTTGLPKPGTPAFESLLKNEARMIFAASKAGLGDPVFPYLLFPTGPVVGTPLFDGSPPTLLGKTDCGANKCLVIEISEEMEASFQQGSTSGVAKGHILLEMPSLKAFQVVIYLKGEIRGIQNPHNSETLIIMTLDK